MRLLYCFVFLLIPEVGIAQQSIQQQLNSCQLLLGKAVIESNQYQMINQQLNYSYDEQGKALKEAIDDRNRILGITKEVINSKAYSP